MSTLLLEGFDDYGPTNNNPTLVEALLNSGEWNYGNVYTVPSIVASLNGEGGLAVQLNATATSYGTVLSKTLATNYSRLIGGVRFSTALLGPCGVAFGDGTTPQCSIVVESGSGFLEICQSFNGTVLQSTSTSVSANTVHYLEWDITFNTNGTLGGWTVWLDGVQILHGTGVTAQSADNYANIFQLVNFVTSGGGSVTFDDLYLFSSAGAQNNAVLLSNPIVITQAPSADHQTQFTNIGNVVGSYFSSEYGASGYYTDAANQLLLQPVTPNVNCTVNAVVINISDESGSSGTANMRGVIYADSAGAPGALLKSGTEVTGFAPSQQITLPLTAGQALTAGTQYWIGLINDTSTLLLIEGAGTTSAYAANTFTSGAPGSAPTMTYGGPTLYMFADCTGAATNWESMALNPPIGDQSSIQANTAGTTDLYVFPNLPSNVYAVYAVAVKGLAKLTYAGSHTFDMVISSGGTLAAGSNTGITPNLSYQGYESAFDADPGTGAAWTISGVDASYAGVEVVT